MEPSRDPPAQTPVETLRAALAAATPGPWRCVPKHDYFKGSPPVVVTDASKPPGLFVVRGAPNDDLSVADAALIAAAVNALPALIAVAEAGEAMYPHARSKALSAALAALEGADV